MGSFVFKWYVPTLDTMDMDMDKTRNRTQAPSVVLKNHSLQQAL